jgi:hypothetical protein
VHLLAGFAAMLRARAMISGVSHERHSWGRNTTETTLRAGKLGRHEGIHSTQNPSANQWRGGMNRISSVEKEHAMAFDEQAEACVK